MTKILYIAPVNSDSGWGECARAIARSMASVGLDFKMEDIRLDRTHIPLDADLIEYTQRDLTDTYAVIQNVLPSYFYYDGRFEHNIGKFVFESSLNNSPWLPHLEIMDQHWVTSYVEEHELKYVVPNINCSSIGEAVDIDAANRQYAPYAGLRETKETYVFYTVAEFNQRKNLESMILAYLSTFTYKDSVHLVIKTNNNISELIDGIKKRLRIFNDDRSYPLISILHDRLPKEGIYGLHQDCDCFVNTSYGESFCRPAAEAIVFGNEVIYPKNTGVAAFMENYGIAIDTFESPCYVENPPMDYAYKGDQRWFEVKPYSIGIAMRQAYSNGRRKIDYSKIIDNVSYKTVGNNIKKCLGL